MFKLNPKEKFRLFKQSDRFCGVPWHLLYVQTNGDVHSCSKGRVPLGNVITTPIIEILNDDSRKSLKDSILTDKPNKNCDVCIARENQGNNLDKYTHIRGGYNKLFYNQDIDYHNTNEFKLGAVDLHWSSICDLKCVTCWAPQSSSIALEQGEVVRHTPTKQALELIDWIVEHQQTLTEVYLSGGEPTLIKYNLKLLRQLEKRPDLIIRVNSNLMWDTDNAIVQEILKFPNVLFTCSADSLGQRFEYIRRNAKWDKFLKNLSYLKKFDNVEIRINSVFFVLSCSTLLDTIDFFVNNFDITDFTINQCGMGHSYLQSRNISDALKKQCASKIQDGIIRYNGNLNLVGQLNNCLVELNATKEEGYEDYLNSIDLLEHTNWRTTFKELT